MENFNEQEYLKYKEYMLNKLGERDSLIKHVKLGYFGELNKDDVINPFFPRFVKEWCGDIELRELSIYLNTTSRQYDELLYDRQELESILKNREALKQIFPQIAEKVEIFCVEKNIYSSNSTTKGIRKDVKVPSFDKVEHTLPEVIYANKIIETISEKINSKNLSPFEKYCLCFILVQYDVMYNNDEAKFDKNYNPRSLISTVANMEGVCMGKSLMLQKLLSMVGVEARCIPVSLKKMSAEQQNDSPETTDHVINIVAFKDEEYGMNGLFALDVTNEKIFIPINEVFEKALVQTSFLYAFEDISSFYNYAYENFLPEYLDSQVNAKKYNDQESTMGQLFENYNFGEFVSLLANGRNLNKPNETILIDWLNKKFNEENKTFGFYTMEADNEFSDFIKKAKSCHSWKELKEFAYARKNGFEDADMTRQLKPLEEGLDSDRASLDLAYDYLYKEVKKHINTIYALNDLRWLKEMERPTEEAIERCGENIDNTLNQIRNKLNQQESHNDLELA